MKLLASQGTLLVLINYQGYGWVSNKAQSLCLAWPENNQCMSNERES